MNEQSKQTKITEIQQEYENLVSKLNQLRNDIKEPVNINHNILTEYGKIKLELIAIKNEIQNIEKKLFNSKEKYIKKKELKLLIKLAIIGSIIPTILIIISLAFINPYLLTNLEIICYLLGMPIVLGTPVTLIYPIFREKYLSKLERKYMESNEYQNYQKELDEKIKTKETIEQKLRLKEKELEEGYKNVNTISYQINLTTQKIKQLKEQLTELILPNSNNIEFGYIFNKTSQQDKTTLTRKLTPPTINK